MVLRSITHCSPDLPKSFQVLLELLLSGLHKTHFAYQIGSIDLRQNGSVTEQVVVIVRALLIPRPCVGWSTVYALILQASSTE
jgi:hypothetical protein